MRLKKVVLFILVIVMFFPIYTFATNEGPYDKLEQVINNPYSSGGTGYPGFLYTSYIKFVDLSSYKVYNIYSENTTKNELNGAVYDKTTNTLKINNIEGDYRLEIYMMGSDFKIEVIGTNKISNIETNANGYNGSIHIIGNGTLEIKDTSMNPAISIEASNSESVLEVENTVTLKLQSNYKTIDITNTKASNPVKLKNGQSINIIKTSGSGFDIYKTLYNPSNALSKSIKVINENDTENLYAVNNQLIHLEGKLGVFVYKLIKVDVKIEYPYTTEFKDADCCYIAALENAQFFECLKNNKEKVLKDNGYILQEETIGPVAIAGTYHCGEYYEYIDYGDNNDEIIDADVADISRGSGTYGLFSDFIGEDGKTYCIANRLLYINSSKVIGSVEPTISCYVQNRNISILPTVINKDKNTNEEKNQNNEEIINVNQVKGLNTTKQTTKDITLKWDTIKGATGYEVCQYNSKMKKNNIKETTTKTIYKISNLSVATTYKFKVRAYKKVNEKTYYGPYSSILITTTKTKTPSISKIIPGSKKMTIKWKKTSGATGYEIIYSTNKNFKSGNKKIKITNNKTLSKNIKKLKGKKKYYIKIRTYRTVNKTKYYSAWSNTKKITTKK